MARKVQAEDKATSAKLRLFIACGKDLSCVKGKLNFGRKRIVDEMIKDKTPVIQPIPEDQRLSNISSIF